MVEIQEFERFLRAFCAATDRKCGVSDALSQAYTGMRRPKIVLINGLNKVCYPPSWTAVHDRQKSARS